MRVHLANIIFYKSSSSDFENNINCKHDPVADWQLFHWEPVDEFL